MWSMRLVTPITEATTVRWHWLASSHCCGLSFLTDHPPAQTHCRKHAVAQMGVTFNCSPAAYLTSLKPSPLHTIFSLLARITASWDTQDSEEQGEVLIAGELKKEEGNMMHIHVQRRFISSNSVSAPQPFFSRHSLTHEVWGILMPLRVQSSPCLYKFKGFCSQFLPGWR